MATFTQRRWSWALCSIFVALLLALAILAPTVLNNLKLNRFAEQLDKVEGVFTGSYRLLAEGQEIYVGGNDDGCSYRATRAYRYYLSDENLTRKLRALRFENADVAEAEDAEPEVYLSVANHFVLISIQSGPFSAGLDLRCY